MAYENLAAPILPSALCCSSFPRAPGLAWPQLRGPPSALGQLNLLSSHLPSEVSAMTPSQIPGKGRFFMPQILMTMKMVPCVPGEGPPAYPVQPACHTPCCGTNRILNTERVPTTYPSLPQRNQYCSRTEPGEA